MSCLQCVSGDDMPYALNGLSAAAACIMPNCAAALATGAGVVGVEVGGGGFTAIALPVTFFNVCSCFHRCASIGGS